MVRYGRASILELRESLDMRKSCNRRIAEGFQTSTAEERLSLNCRSASLVKKAGELQSSKCGRDSIVDMREILDKAESFEMPEER
jgi:hypothetical protein